MLRNSAALLTHRDRVEGIKAILPHLAMKTDLRKLERKMIRWLLFTSLAAGSLAFAAAKFVV